MNNWTSETYKNDRICKAEDIQDLQRHKGTFVVPLHVIMEVLERLEELRYEEENFYSIHFY